MRHYFEFMTKGLSTLAIFRGVLDDYTVSCLAEAVEIAGGLKLPVVGGCESAYDVSEFGGEGDGFGAEDDGFGAEDDGFGGEGEVCGDDCTSDCSTCGLAADSCGIAELSAYMEKRMAEKCGEAGDAAGLGDEAAGGDDESFEPEFEAGFEPTADCDCNESVRQLLDALGRFASSLYEVSLESGVGFGNLSEYLEALVLTTDNAYAKAAGKGIDIPESLKWAAERELKTLEEMAALAPADFATFFENTKFADVAIPQWEVKDIDLVGSFEDSIRNIHKNGYGEFAKYRAFCLDDTGELKPIKHPDQQGLDQLYGYERERELIIKNTEALLNKGVCNNVLLYGDAGTGKSSTIKAIAKEYAADGLRLIEVKKNQLFLIPGIVEKLAELPLKFILFIDDLSFTANDDNFSALKAILEGSMSTVGDNIAIYATSNRRHLVKETSADRDGDDIHVNDTIQETFSLSARFGLMVTFQKPGKDKFLDIVKALANEHGIDTDEETLFSQAEVYALRANGRTPRVAQQYIKSLRTGL